MSNSERKAREAAKKDEKEKGRQKAATSKTSKQRDHPVSPQEAKDADKARSKTGAVPKPEQEDLHDSRSLQAAEAQVGDDELRGGERRTGTTTDQGEGKEEESKPPPKMMPVFFLDEAHKVSAAGTCPRGTDTDKVYTSSFLRSSSRRKR